MSRWTCPACDREFARAKQAHVCMTGNTVDATFAGRPAVQRAIYDAVLIHLRTLGPLHEDAVRIGVFLKAERKLAELRPKARWLSLELVLGRSLAAGRVSRELRVSADRVVHVIKLASVDDVDDQLRQWLTEAYFHASDTEAT
ncbi:MAG: hypothetical protein JWL70_168 [Acidimicrobiia bacterium]|nr:hypothetical protein [Acidimicrobiia bacterium]